MNLRLTLISNWSERAVAAHFSVKQMAAELNISPRTLRRYVKEQFKQNPKRWLIDMRRQHVLQVMKREHCVKTTALTLGYNYLQNFSRDFKKFFGSCPTTFVTQRDKILNEGSKLTM
jgi:AraC-like DNA-binding protein